jgi:hypothetical protein
MIEDRDWQKIGYGSTRLKVPGGWFVLLYTGGSSKASFFYPDENHEWDGSALPSEPPAPVKFQPQPSSSINTADVQASSDTDVAKFDLASDSTDPEAA